MTDLAGTPGALRAPSPGRLSGAAGACHAGIRTIALDLALVFNEDPATPPPEVFTRNQVRAAPVLWTQQCHDRRRLRAVILSGSANACTGPPASPTPTPPRRRWPRWTRGTGPGIEVAVCSTGLIGDRLPMDKRSPASPVVHEMHGEAGRRR